MPINNLFVNAARKGAEMGFLGRMCSGCAFKPGTEANDDAEFIETSAMHMASGCGFKCHLEDKDCAGFLYVKRYMDSIED